MSPNLRRTLISGVTFFAIFSVLTVFLQYQNEDFALGSLLANSFFVTMLYVGFTWVFRRFFGGPAEKPTPNKPE